MLDTTLEKAQEIQDEIPALKFREVEQAVFATFLHSQPIGQKAATRDLILLLGQARPDKIELEKALQQWANVSWFLDEALTQEAEAGAAGTKQLPKYWRLGSKPNLRQIHHVACTRVSGEFIEARLLEEIAKVKRLDEGARAAGARVHMLPERPSDIEDDGEFHYAVLGPKAASDPGKPNAEVAKLLNETTGSDRPRVHRNTLVLAVPSRDGLEGARNRIREHLGWEEVRSLLKDHDLDPIRAGMLATYLESSKKKIPDAIRQSYCIVATVSEKNEVLALKVGVGAEPLFATIKGDKRVRILETAISAEALLPDGPYNLWREGETSRWVKDLVGAFASDVRLPKMLNRKAILATLVDGCKEGLFVLRLVRPDRSVRTWWREAPDEIVLEETALELVLPEAAQLTALQPSLLAPGVVPGLWPNGPITVRHLLEFFENGRTVKVPKDGYEDVISIPRADRGVVEQAVRQTVHEGKLWLTSGPASILAEEIPAGILTDDAVLQLPPPPILPMQLIPDVIPEAWENGRTTALALTTALSKREGRILPWATIRDALAGAFDSRYLEHAVDSGPWPCDYAGAQQVRITLPTEKGRPEPPTKPHGVLAAETVLTVSQIQDLAEGIGAIVKAAAGYNLKFLLRVELGDASKQPTDSVVAEINRYLTKIVAGLKIK